MTGISTRFQVDTAEDGKQVLSVAGDWTIWTVAQVEEKLRNTKVAYDAILDVSQLEKIDTSGAYLIDRALGALEGIDEKIPIRGEHPTIERLLGKVRKASPAAPPDPIRPPGFIALLDRAGHGAVDAWGELLGLLSFIGETMATLGRLAANPHRIRWKSVVAIMEEAGLDALPIVCFLSFFIGLVIAFIGANLLAMFNASVFTVELVAIGMLREFGAVLTAILLAGRTDSAFTAQIGAMKMRQEIDAMRTIGLDPMEALVAPRLIALVLMTPLLTFAATISGIGGGLIAAWTAMNISPQMFISRFQEVVPPQHFWVGIAKAPVFALVVAMIGCRQGMLVEGDVVSLGRRTTSAVVQAIFMVIALDAMFAVLYYMLNI
ncbi:MAG: MlaE family lipid ABC transporter permease subunit [Hyphomonadaceae bacterium]|nr:MlaE family lipid ABC transporter permease subunit [Hyphomonadaceae bacterium]MBP9233351.1 MlaE family lipid ABC transporter permease subunit [Hyphomonadaceae bacterium]